MGIFRIVSLVGEVCVPSLRSRKRYSRFENMLAMSLPIVLLAIAVASSASPVPTDIKEDYSDFGFLSHPDDSLVIYRVAEGDIIEAEELRHLEKRSPLVPFPFPLAKKPLKKPPKKKKPKKVFLKPKLLKKSPFIKKGIKKGGPPLLLAGAGLSAPSIPAVGFGLPAGAAGLAALGAFGGGFGGGN